MTSYIKTHFLAPVYTQSQFPPCKDKISISCLNLHYSIMIKKSNTANNDEVTDPNELVELRKEDSKQPLVATNSADTVSQYGVH